MTRPLTILLHTVLFVFTLPALFAAHEENMKVKIYYTVRELSNRCPEIFALRSLGDEILAYGPGSGYSWLQEHLGSNYIAGWFVPRFKDAAVFAPTDKIPVAPGKGWLLILS